MTILFHHEESENWSFCTESLEETVDRYLEENGAVSEDGVISIYQGRQTEPNVSQFISDLLDGMADSASFGNDFAGGWPHLDDSDEEEFQGFVESAISDWFKQKGLKPTWFAVVDVKEVKVQLSGYDYEHKSYCEALILNEFEEQAA